VVVAPSADLDASGDDWILTLDCPNSKSCAAWVKQVGSRLHVFPYNGRETVGTAKMRSRAGTATTRSGVAKAEITYPAIAATTPSSVKRARTLSVGATAMTLLRVATTGTNSLVEMTTTH